MNHHEKMKQYLDGLPIEFLRFCAAGGPCACRGCVNQHGVRDRHLIKYAFGTLLEGQYQRPDIIERQSSELKQYGNPNLFTVQYGYIKNGVVWAQYLRCCKGEPATVDIQLTGSIFKGLQMLTLL
jgi:hypothetical protein